MDEAVRGFALGLFFGILLPALRELLPPGDPGGGGGGEDTSALPVEEAVSEPAMIEDPGPRPWDAYPAALAGPLPPAGPRSPRRLLPSSQRRRASKLGPASRT